MQRGGEGPPRLRLYAWPTPNAQKVSIMLEECAIPYEVIAVDINKGEQFAPGFLAISPNNRIPAIVDGEIALFESGAILVYLAERVGRFMADRGTADAAMADVPDRRTRADVRPGASFPPDGESTDTVRRGALHQRGRAAIWRDGPAARRSAISPASIPSPTSRAGRGCGRTAARASRSTNFRI